MNGLFYFIIFAHFSLVPLNVNIAVCLSVFISYALLMSSYCQYSL